MERAGADHRAAGQAELQGPAQGRGDEDALDGAAPEVVASECLDGDDDSGGAEEADAAVESVVAFPPGADVSPGDLHESTAQPRAVETATPAAAAICFHE